MTCIRTRTNYASRRFRTYDVYAAYSSAPDDPILLGTSSTPVGAVLHGAMQEFMGAVRDGKSVRLVRDTEDDKRCFVKYPGRDAWTCYYAVANAAADQDWR